MPNSLSEHRGCRGADQWEQALSLQYQPNKPFRSVVKATTPGMNVHALTAQENQLCRIVQSIADGLHRHPSSSRIRLECSALFLWRRCSRYCAGVAFLPLLAFIPAPLAVFILTFSLGSAESTLRSNFAVYQLELNDALHNWQSAAIGRELSPISCKKGHFRRCAATRLQMWRQVAM